MNYECTYQENRGYISFRIFKVTLMQNWTKVFKIDIKKTKIKYFGSIYLSPNFELQ